jgi:hypothetical protein
MDGQPTDAAQAVPAAGPGNDAAGRRRPRKRPRGFYARLARARGVSFNVVYRELNPDKRPCVREKNECDAGPPWDERELIRMDRAFCEAMEREIARGTERPRGPMTKPVAARAPRPRRRSPRRSGAASTPQARANPGERDRLS